MLSLSHQDAAKSEIRLFSFDPVNKAPAGGLEDTSSPHVSSPLSLRYHWSVSVQIRLLVLTLCEWLCVDNSLFSVTPQKWKVACHLLFPSRGIQLFVSCFSQSRFKTQPEWELNMLFWPQNKSPLNLFHSLCLSKLWFSRNGILDMNFEWKQKSVGSVGRGGRAASLTALLN